MAGGRHWLLSNSRWGSAAAESQVQLLGGGRRQGAAADGQAGCKGCRLGCRSRLVLLLAFTEGIANVWEGGSVLCIFFFLITQQSIVELVR